VGQNIAKLDLRAVQATECAMLAHAKATTDVAAANMACAQVLRDQAVLALFTIPKEERLSQQAHRFLELRRQEEILQVEERVAKNRASQVHVEPKDTDQEAELNDIEVAAQPLPPSSPRAPASPTSTPMEPIVKCTQSSTLDSSDEDRDYLDVATQHSHNESLSGHFRNKFSSLAPVHPRPLFPQVTGESS
jgi:hypothetical protein